MKINELVTLKPNKRVALRYPTYGEDERAWHIGSEWLAILRSSMALCGGSVTLTTASYRHRDGCHELFVEEYLRADTTDLCYLLTRSSGPGARSPANKGD